MNTIEINMDKPCARCGKPGATGTGENGWCLKCISKGMAEGRFDRILRPGDPNPPGAKP